MKTIYIDMDGVVADFNEYARRIHKFGNEVEYPDHLWNKIAQNKRLYRDLKKTPYADDLVNYCTNLASRLKLETIFLTAVPKSNSLHWAFTDKVEWARLHFPHVPVHFGPFSHDKHVHCTPGDILIDDRSSNIKEWNNVGGIGILHTTYENTINLLNNLQP